MVDDVGPGGGYRGRIGDAASPSGFDVTFFGVRGSTPCHGGATSRYGGNTSCVSVDVAGQPPIMFDIGTGARYYGQMILDDEAFHGHCLLTHAHWDHIQGLPFFPPLLRSPVDRLDIYAPATDEGGDMGDMLELVMAPPVFPVGIDTLPGSVAWTTVADTDFSIGDVQVMARQVPHTGATVGYRLSAGGRTVTYISDHQQPGVDRFEATDGVRELCAGADLLIHDAQYTPAEFAERPDWGHSTIDYAIWLAETCGVATLALYHHDPTHDDDMLDELVADYESRTDLDLFAAAEGLSINLGS